MGAWKVSYNAETIDLQSYDWCGMPQRGPGVDLENIPSGLSRAPFTYVDLNTGLEHKMQFVGGLFSISQDPQTLALEPKFGYAVIEM